MQKNNTPTERPPIVAIMGHIDHGKSTLLDFIRSSNIVAGEAGGITQHLSAYEVVHTNEAGIPKKITFLDTPGHEAFSHMRERGAHVADIALLIVSAEDGVKTQTKEAWATIEKSKTPAIVVINKIDKPGANIEKVKMELAENGVYIEGYGGQIPVCEVSAKSGVGIPNLLSTILLVAELEGFTANSDVPAEGYVIESNMDQKRGISATIVIKNGTLKTGMSLVAGSAIASTRLIEDFMGKSIKEATFSSPIRITGFDSLPAAGSQVIAFEKKRDAEEYAIEQKQQSAGQKVQQVFKPGMKVVPIVIKTDVSGTGDAILKELASLETETLAFKVITLGVGSITENDIKSAAADPETLIVGFNVSMDTKARDANEHAHATVETFTIIYKLIDWLKIIAEERRPRETTVEVSGVLKIMRIFNRTKERIVVGGRVTSGLLTGDAKVRILRRDFEIGTGKIIELQHGKIRAKQVEAEQECGLMIETKVDIAIGDSIEAFTLVTK